jgi:hydroxymethylbilane synthase
MVHELVVGTRGSDLALAQTKLACDAINAARPDVRLVPRMIRTSADEGMPEEENLGPAGRKGLFTAEIERALVAREIDLAVHSAKDLASELLSGTEVRAALPRANPGDVLVTRSRGDIRSLPEKATIATGSIRRKHQLRWQRPDVSVVALRGNVPTRLRKLHENGWNGVILAAAGIARLLGREPNESFSFDGRDYSVDYLSLETFVPAAGQGTIAVQVRADDRHVRGVVELIDSPPAHLCLRAEREFLRLLQADCNCPIGVLARIEGEKLKMRAQIFSDDLPAPTEALVEGPFEPEKLAAELFGKIHGHCIFEEERSDLSRRRGPGRPRTRYAARARVDREG